MKTNINTLPKSVPNDKKIINDWVTCSIEENGQELLVMYPQTEVGSQNV